MFKVTRDSFTALLLSGVLAACGSGTTTKQHVLPWQRVQREFASAGIRLSSSAITSPCATFSRPFRTSCEAVKRRGAVALRPEANLFGGNGGRRGVGTVIVVQATGSALSDATHTQARVMKLAASDLTVVVFANVIVSYWRGPTASKIERVIGRLKHLAGG
jgi:hypothetical protein